MMWPHRRPADAPRLMEIVTPRSCGAVMASAERLLGTAGLREPFSLEIAASDSATWFLGRARNVRATNHLQAQLSAAYPQADLKPLDTARFPSLDAARLAPGEQVAACALALREPMYLPIRTFEDGWEGRADHSQDERAALAVLHYDADYDFVAAITGQPMRWVVPRGSIP